MRKKTTTNPYCFRLKSKKLCFRLDLNSPQYALWNRYLEKKKEIKLAFSEITTMAREQLTDNRHNETFILDLIEKEERHTQRAVDKIFELALERYHRLEREGKVPILSSAISRPRLEETKPRETGEPNREREFIAPQTDNPLAEIERAFPSNLRDLLTFDIEGTNAILKQKKWLEPETYNSIMTIVTRLRGERNRERKVWTIPLPLEKK